MLHCHRVSVRIGLRGHTLDPICYKNLLVETLAMFGGECRDVCLA